MNDAPARMSSHAVDRDSKRTLQVRLLILGLLCLAPISAYLTRVISAINTTLRSEFTLDDIAMGAILGAFNIGYLIFQVPGGWLAQRFSVRRIFPILAVCWSLSTIAFSLSLSEWSLYVSRVIMGLSQAGLVPCCALVISAWVKEQYRGLYSSLIGISMQIGGVIATSLTGHLLLGTLTDPPTPMRWSSIYIYYAMSGLAFALCFFWVYREAPATHPWLKGEVSLPSVISSTSGATSAVDQVPEAAIGQEINENDTTDAMESSPLASRLTAWQVIVTMLASVAMWMICIQGFFRAFAYEFFTTWFTAYLEQARGMKLDDAGNWASLPIIAFGVGSLLGGFGLDLIFLKTGNKWISRSLTAAVSMGLCAICTFMAAFVNGNQSAILLISLGAFLASIAGPCTWAACLDICGKRSAVVFGIMNSIGAGGALLCPIIVGYLFDYIKSHDADWNYVLYLFVFVNFAGAITWLLLNPNRPIFNDESNA